MISSQIPPVALDIIDQQFDDLESCLREISVIYQNHPDPFHFGHVLAFNCIWRWQGHFIKRENDGLLPSFQTIKEIYALFPLTRISHH